MMSVDNVPALATVGAVLVVSTLFFCSGGNKGEAPPVAKKAPKAKKPKASPNPPEEAPKASNKNKKKALAAAAPPTERPASQAPLPSLVPVKAAAPAPAPAPPAASKQQQKKKQKAAGGAPKPAAAVVAAPLPVENEPVEEEEKPAPPPPEVAAPASKVATAPNVALPVEDGWTSVDTSKKDKRKEKAEVTAAAAKAADAALAAAASAAASASAAAAAASGAPAAAAVAKPTLPEKSIGVDPRKVGVLIGPKGATLKRIEELSGCRIHTAEGGPEERDTQAKVAPVRIVGPDPDAVALAEKLIIEVCSKGYAVAIEGGDFTEAAVEVAARCVPDLIGTGGSVVKALRTACGVHVAFPPEKKRTDESKPVKVRGKGQQVHV